MRLQNFKFVKSSVVTFQGLKLGQKISIDQTLLGTASKNGEIIFSGITPGARNLTVTKNGYWPWGKELTLASGEMIDFKPFLLAQIPNVEILTLSSSNFQSLKERISPASLPGSENPTKSSDSKSELWVDGNSIMVKNLEDKKPAYFCNPDCIDTLKIFNSNSEIKSVAFFPLRSDLVLFSTPEGIFAIEVDDRSIRNFQPLYKGEFINFAVLDDKIFILVTEEKIYNILP